MKVEKLEGAPAVKPSFAPRRSAVRSALNALVIPALALFSGLVLSAFFILVSDVTVLTAYSKFLSDPGGALARASMP